jgi:divalent anion:Na+ symporter, DASS family
MAIYAREVEAIGTEGESVLRFLPSLRTPLLLSGSLLIGFLIWNIPPSASLDVKGVQFLATLAVGVVLWVGDVFDDYVVGMMLLMSWVVLGIVPSKLALSGFSHSSWFFVVAALGLGAAVGNSGLLHRLAMRVLNRIPLSCHKTHTFVLFVSGLLITPLLPTGKARAVIALPVSQAIAKATGFSDRSHGSAALSLAALIGFSHMSFMFLTGGEFCLIGWNLLPVESKARFGWMDWFVAALPTGILVFLFVFLAIHFLFPLRPEDRIQEVANAPHPHLQNAEPLSPAEWIAMTVLALTLVGWLTKPWHCIDETWVALGGLLAFLTTGGLDKKSFRDNLDWGLVIFFGIINSMAVISDHLKIDRWLSGLLSPALAYVSTTSVGFLLAVILIVCVTRVFLRKSPSIALMTLILVPVGHNLGIHPGVILLTILAASECFFLPYQDGPYQLAYSSTDGQAFSHAQARKILAARFLATTLAITLSVPYWKLLGLIQ